MATARNRMTSLRKTLNEEFYEHREQASSAAAARIADRLSEALDTRPEAAIVVTGGSTPAPVYERLSQLVLDWDRVTVTLSDERWVPADDDDSNEKLLRSRLLVAKAAAASLLPLYRENTDPQAASEALERQVSELPLPFACSLLGMGGDGHFASLFPDYDGLPAALDPQGARRVVPVKTAASPHPRISLTLAALLESDEIILLFFGDDKLQVYEAAKAGDSKLPVAALLAQARVPVRAIWAP